ncbi:hypothetical protein Tco_0597680 [Tanacetum coccineum]
MEGYNGSPAFVLPKRASNNRGKLTSAFPPLPVFLLDTSSLLSYIVLPIPFGALSDIPSNPTVLLLALRMTGDPIRKAGCACLLDGGLGSASIPSSLSSLEYFSCLCNPSSRILRLLSDIVIKINYLLTAFALPSLCFAFAAADEDLSPLAVEDLHQQFFFIV